MGITGGVFFIDPADASGSDSSDTRNVSFFSPEAGDSGAGITETDNGGENWLGCRS